jgi:hypothetical protein
MDGAPVSLSLQKFWTIMGGP